MWYNNLLTLEISFLCAIRFCKDFVLRFIVASLRLIVVIIKKFMYSIPLTAMSVCVRALLFIITLHGILSNPMTSDHSALVWL